MSANPFLGQIQVPKHTVSLDNAAGVVTLEAPTGKLAILTGLSASYDGDPTAGTVTIACTGYTSLVIDLIKGGAGPDPFGKLAEPGLFFPGSEGKDITITIAAGGVGVKGKLNATWKLAG